MPILSSTKSNQKFSFDLVVLENYTLPCVGMKLLNFFQAMKNKPDLPNSVRVAVVGAKSNKKLMTIKDKDKM